MMAAKKRKLLPSLEDLEQRAKVQKEASKIAKDSVESLSGLDLFSLSSSKQQKLTNDEKVCWLISRLSFKTVSTVCSTLRALPSTLTKQQRITILREQVQLCQTSIEDMLSFLDVMPEVVKAFSKSCDLVVLAPPVGHCLECRQRLTAYNKCQVKCYLSDGATYGHKCTLRCTHCKLFYNYAQYGNKHERGFRYYPSPQLFVEASDTTFTSRNLLELQCSLA